MTRDEFFKEDEDWNRLFEAVRGLMGEAVNVPARSTVTASAHPLFQAPEIYRRAGKIVGPVPAERSVRRRRVTKERLKRNCRAANLGRVQ